VGLRRALHFCWWTGAIIVVVLALALSAARLLLPEMSGYRAQIEQVAAGTFGRPVSIGSLDAAWRGLSPVLKLEKVVVSDPRLPRGQITIDEVEVAVDLVDSLLRGELRTAGIRLIGTRLEVDTDIRHHPRQFPLRSVAAWLTEQDSIALEKVQLRWNDPGLFDVPVHLRDLSAKLVNSGRRHQLLLDAQLPMSLGESLRVAADLYGGDDDISRWHGTLYLRTRDFQLSRLLPAMADSGVAAGGAANLELWVGLAGARPVWGSGSLDWQKPALRSTSADVQGVGADDLSAKFHWRWRSGRWRIGVKEFEVRRHDVPVWPASDFDLLVRDDAELRLQGKANLVVLDEVNGVLPLLPWMDEGALSMIDRLQPRGLMRNAEFEWRYRPGQTPRFAMRSAIENLSLAANRGLPGVTGVSGTIEGNLRAGRLHLATAKAQLIAPRIFAQPLPLEGVSGDIRWQRFLDGFRIGTKKMVLQSGRLALQSRWQIDWSNRQAAPFLDLQLAADPLPLVAVRDYLPAEVMSPHAVSWLQHAFVAGTASNIRLLIQGRLDQLPFDGNQGRLEARFDFRDATLDYHPGWGQLEDLEGHALFSGRSMHIEARAARILDSPVERAVAVIRDLKQPVLEIDGTVNGTLAAMLEYVRQSPLRQHFGDLVEKLDSTGDAGLHLRLDIPLRHGHGKARVNGDVVLAGNDLVSSQSGIGLTDIHGNLRFTHSGVTVRKARARLLGEPVVVSVGKETEEPESPTVVDVRGRLKLVDAIKKKDFALTSYLDGGAQWQALLKIRNEVPADGPRVTMELRSDLEGVAVRLPQPLAKQADEKRSLIIGWVPGKEIGQPMWARYGDLVSARILLGSGYRLRKAAIHAGDTLPELPPRDEVHVSGRAPVFDLGEWLPVFSALGAGGGRDRALPPSLDLSADLFSVGGEQVHDITVHSKYTDPWYFQVDGEGARGWLRWLHDKRAAPAQLLSKLEYLKIQGGTEKEATGESLRPEPAQFPQLNFEIGDLQWRGRDLGQVNIASQRTPDGMHFGTLKVNSPAIALDGSGDWLEYNGSQTSSLRATITGGTLEKLSELFGSQGTVKGGKLAGSLQASWPGSPAAFSLARMEGEFDLKARDGRLENVEEGAGKLLSLFSLNSLQRRLNLDFRDVVKEGFSFDLMKGHFVVMDGNAFTDDFSINGTSANIDISGRTGLVAHDYDQLVTVTPQVTSTLPIAGAIAGGPAVGAAVFLADKLVGDRVNRLTQVKYHVTGSWDTPVYTKLKKDKGKKSGKGGDGDR